MTSAPVHPYSGTAGYIYANEVRDLICDVRHPLIPSKHSQEGRRRLRSNTVPRQETYAPSATARSLKFIADKDSEKSDWQWPAAPVRVCRSLGNIILTHIFACSGEWHLFPILVLQDRGQVKPTNIPMNPSWKLRQSPTSHFLSSRPIVMRQSWSPSMHLPLH